MYTINLYEKDNNFIAQYPNLESLSIALRQVEHFRIYFNDICECNNYKYNKGYTCKDVKEIRIVQEEE